MRPTLPIAMVTLALLAGCAPTADSSAGPPAPVTGASSVGGAPASAGRSSGGNGALPPCPAGADITKTLGVTVTREQEPVRNGTTSVICGYDGKLANGGGTGVQVHLQVGGAKAEYDALKKSAADQGYPTGDRSGIGDEAFTFTVAAAYLNNLVVVKANIMVSIAAQASFDQEVALANLIIAG